MRSNARSRDDFSSEEEVDESSRASLDVLWKRFAILGIDLPNYGKERRDLGDGMAEICNREDVRIIPEVFANLTND